MTWTLNNPLNLPELEQQVMAHWADRDVPARFAEYRRGAPRWVTYEGPPTVNGKPALHHVWTTVYKDVYGRFHTLNGKFVERKAGWDCQGLPIEIAVERELGLKTKNEIEEYGVEKFVERCRELVTGNVGVFEDMLKRVGYWVDYENPYKTMDESFIESAWFQLSKVNDAGLLYEGNKVVPYCTRCGTGLSSHELGQPGVYQDVTDVSAYVAMPLVGDAENRELVVWTTTPWTLPMNVAVALVGSQQFAQVDEDGRQYVVLAQLAETVFPDHQVGSTIAGSELVGREYVRPFPDMTPTDGASGIVIDWEDTAVDVGTGMVHIAPSFGEDDAQLGKKYELAPINLVGPDGRYIKEAGPLAGKHVGEVEREILDGLTERDRLVRARKYKHPYPHCWRCQTRLIYWAKPSWYIRASAMRDKFVEQNERVTWHPETIKEGRFGNWVRGAVDWALPRDRYWGTPLPVWRCDDGHIKVINGRAELAELAGRDLSEQRLHRPYIDEVTFPCVEPGCSKTAVREAAVCDVWLDSGAMPAAQWGFPHVKGSAERFEDNFPADFICEAIDQTRGWFYSLLALNTMAFGSTPYKNVVCLGLLVDDEGRKMSKSIGNVID
ncbi:MAG: isoleucine--tRNA ligase, partial [Thermoleophilia bacterium]|nr:isoleucine--tRNA ligase [Thermoleophilia bacterium]